GLPKGIILNVTVKVVTEVRAIRQVEELADQPEARALSELNILAHPQVQLEKGLATERVEGELFTSARCQTSPQLSGAVVPVGEKVRWVISRYDDVRVAATASHAEYINALDAIVGTSRSELHDRRNLDAPRQVKHGVQDPAVAFVIGRGSKVSGPERIIGVDRAVA